jgi:hypothetical protein
MWDLHVGFARLQPGGSKIGWRVSRGRKYGRICPESFGGRPMSRPFAWSDSSMATQRDDRHRPLPSAQCSLCGIALPTGLMVPDGGQACVDIRWYCKDAKSCTERWTASLPRHPHIAPTPPSLAPPSLAQPSIAPPTTPMTAGGRVARDRRPSPGPDPVPADLLASPIEEAWSIDPT